MHDAAREQARHSQGRRFEVFQAAHLDWRRHWQQNSFLDVRAKSAEEKSRAAQTSALYEAASIHTVGSLHRVLHCQNLNPSCCCAAKATQFPASPEIGQQATPQDGAFTRAWSYRQPWHDGQLSGPAQPAMKLSLHLPPRLRRQRLRLQQGPLHRRLRSPQRPIRPLSTEPEINPEGCPNGETQHGWCRQSGYSTADRPCVRH